MLEGIKLNFKKKYTEYRCALSCELRHIDNKQNQLICKRPVNTIEAGSVKYKDIYSEKISTLLEVSKVYTRLIQKRNTKPWH